MAKLYFTLKIPKVLEKPLKKAQYCYDHWAMPQITSIVLLSEICFYRSCLHEKHTCKYTTVSVWYTEGRSPLLSYVRGN